MVDHVMPWVFIAIAVGGLTLAMPVLGVLTIVAGLGIVARTGRSRR